MADGGPHFRADEPADEGERWTVRGVSRDARNAAKSAADAGRQSVGEWLTAVVMASASGGPRPADAADIPRQTSIDAVSAIERLVSAASALASAADVPKGTRAPLNRVIREQARLLHAPADISGRQVTPADMRRH